MIHIPMYPVHKYETVRELLDASANLWAEETALSDGERSIDYAQLLSLLRKNARTLCGRISGQSILILSRERRLRLDTAISILSAMYAGIRVILVNSAADSERIRREMEQFGSDWLWTDDRDALGAFPHALPMGILPCEWPEEELREVCGDTDCSVLFTSGTTGEPKSVVITHRALCADAWGATRVFPVGPGMRTLSCLPYYHGYAILADLICMMLNGACLLTATDAGLVKDFLSHRPTHISGVPLLAETIVRLYDSGVLKAEESCLKTFLCSGAAMDAALTDRLAQYGVQLINSYGMTECSTAVAINPPEQNRPESVGIILPCCEAAVSAQGELLLRGENMMKGYGPDGVWPYPDAWFHTGDLVRMDEDGFLYILGRTDHMINLPNGEKVSPEHLEALLLGTGHIKEAQVYQPGNAKYLAARIVPCGDVAAARKAVASVNEKQPPDVRIESIHFCEALERNPLGKIIRRIYNE